MATSGPVPVDCPRVPVAPGFRPPDERRFRMRIRRARMRFIPHFPTGRPDPRDRQAGAALPR